MKQITRKELIAEMETTYQIKDIQTVLQHGESVFNYFKDIMSGELNLDYRLPSWFIENIDFIKENLHSRDILKEYMIFHDCGKPFCKSIDEYG